MSAAPVSSEASTLKLFHSAASMIFASRSPLSLSLSLHFFSTSSSRETQLGISPTISDILLYKYDFPPELASRVASKLTRLENPEKADSVLSFLRESGCSNPQLVKIVKLRPRILAASLEDTIKPKIKIFQELGLSSHEISRIISRNPPILHLSVNKNIVPSLSVMKDLFGSTSEVARVVRKSPWFLTVNLKNNVVPNVEFLKSYGIPMYRIRIILSHFSNPFLVKPEVMRKSVDKAKEMGLSASSRSFIYAITTIASMSNESWEAKLQAFRSLGFSQSEILIMFSKVPPVFLVSMEKIKKIKELLLATGKFNMSCIVNNPSSFQFSIEKRYKPRLRVFGILESRNLIENWPTLRTIYKLSDDKFFKEFIRPYLNEISDVYISSARGKREMKP